MPPRWPREPDFKNDPALRKLEDRINFAVHVAGFALVNSTIWFFNTLNPGSLPLAKYVTFGMVGILVSHAVYIFAIADYSEKKVDVGK
ncbi:MAG: 2TM domain-containing protein [Cyanobacteria bacterium P01_F01_bin.53]